MEDEKQPGSPVPNIPNREGKPHLTTRYLRLNRLPTLQEVLDRRTRPPLDLFCFYVSQVYTRLLGLCARKKTRESVWISSQHQLCCLHGNVLRGADNKIFLQRESAEDALDFWLDVQQHENLCKAYFKVRVQSFHHISRRISDILSHGDYSISVWLTD